MSCNFITLQKNFYFPVIHPEIVIIFTCFGMLDR
jgi:hypothetical protein